MVQKKYDARFRELEEQAIAHVNEIAKRDSKIQTLNVEIRELQAKIHQQSGVITALKMLYQSVDNKIMRTLNERGKHKKPVSVQHPDIQPFDATTNHDDLLRMARKYDAEEFFALKKRVHTHDLRYGYRVVAKAYRTTRDGTKAGMKRVYRLKVGE